MINRPRLKRDPYPPPGTKWCATCRERVVPVDAGEKRGDNYVMRIQTCPQCREVINVRSDVWTVSLDDA